MKNRYVDKEQENGEDDAASDAKRDAPPPTDAEFRQKMLPAMSSAALAPVQNRSIFNRAKTRGMHIYILSSVFTAILLCRRLYMPRSCPSSVTFRCFVETNEATIMRFSPSGRTIILVSGEIKIVWKFAGDHP